MAAVSSTTVSSATTVRAAPTVSTSAMTAAVEAAG